MRLYRMDKKIVDYFKNVYYKDDESPKQIREIVEYGKKLGYFYDEMKENHDEAISSLISEIEKINFKKVVNAFLASLSNRDLHLRNPISFYAIARVLPQHGYEGFKENKNECHICGCSKENVEDGRFYFYQSYFCGSAYAPDIYLQRYILQKFNESEIKEPKKQDFQILKDIINSLRCATDKELPSQVKNRLKGIDNFKTNDAERRELLDTLGILSILDTKKHPGFLNQFTNSNHTSRKTHSSDWAYPVDFWTGKDGINMDALKFWFGDYDELKELFE